jgi:4'-phosphopantetheinyl transferase
VANSQIGVDVERIRSMADADELARTYFAPGEVRAYAAIPPIDRPAAFFSAWTRKEAIVKAVGDGTRVPLDQLEVDISPSCSEPQIAAGVAGGEWRVWSFSPVPGYTAAVACGSTITSLERYHFDDDSLRIVQELGVRS